VQNHDHLLVLSSAELRSLFGVVQCRTTISYWCCPVQNHDHLLVLSSAEPRSLISVVQCRTTITYPQLRNPKISENWKCWRLMFITLL